jgi:kynureninase
MVQGLLAELDKGYTIRFAEADEIMDAIDEDVAAICITHVHYKTGHIHDMAAITKKAQAVGAAAVWDLCHSVGAMPVNLNGCNVDFAVGCTYKYVNCGPGAPSLLFVAKRHHGKYTQPLTGWYGHADPFGFERDYRPVEDVRQMLTGTQPTASLSIAEIGIDIMLRADMQQIRDKSMRMTDLFIELVEERCSDHGFELISPQDANCRGSHVSFHNDDGYSIIRAMHDKGVVCDFRAPGKMRFGFAPLYIRYVDVWDAVDRLHDILTNQIWKEPKYQVRATVT